MMKRGFNQEVYLELQTAAIMERVHQFDKLYLEVGGKIIDDWHAARVLPGFDPQSKIQVLENLRDQLEVIICVSAVDLARGKMRSDSGLSYQQEALRLIEYFTQRNFKISSVVITLCDQSEAVADFVKLLKERGLIVHIHSRTEGYPTNIDKVVSPEGYGKNSFIKTERPVVLVTAPGASSGKMATCLSQIYHEFLAGRRAGYAKYETFPVWNLPINHPVNRAYEAATMDLNDQNMIDPFHQKAYGVEVVNYNRDIATFPVLNEIFQRIFHQQIYQSPTDMGVNMVASAIVDDQVVRLAAEAEIERRYQSAGLSLEANFSRC
jgi:UPF0371 protein FN1121